MPLQQSHRRLVRRQRILVVQVASSLHLTPETFSRVIHNLEDEGLISVDGKKIQVYGDPKEALS